MTIISADLSVRQADRGGCGCPAAHPGILWPWGTDGEYPPALPYVERCDDCGRYDDDKAAAQALASALGRIGWGARIGAHCRTTSGNRLEWVAVFLFPSSASSDRSVDKWSWRVAVATAKRCLEEAPRW